MKKFAPLLTLNIFWLCLFLGAIVRGAYSSPLGAKNDVVDYGKLSELDTAKFFRARDHITLTLQQAQIAVAPDSAEIGRILDKYKIDRADFDAGRIKIKDDGSIARSAQPASVKK
jgi:hypothetical protein